MRGAAILLASLTLTTAVPSATVQPQAQPQVDALIGDTIGLDHVLIWAKDRAVAEAFLTKTLGFQLGPAGSYGQGIRHNIIRFANRSFIEFLWLSDPVAAKKDAPWASDFVSKHNGSNAFGIQVASIDAAHKLLAAAGLRPDEPMSEALDPDGPEGPKPPVVNEWRVMFLDEGAAPGEPFFVEYKRKNPPEAPPAHPNGALQLQSVWIAVADLKAATNTYAKAGLRPWRRVSIRRLNASGVALQTGAGEIVLLTPNGVGPLAQQMKRRGDHVVGMGVRVKDAGATRAFFQKALGRQRLWQSGDQSVVIDATRELGVYIEFQE